MKKIVSVLLAVLMMTCLLVPAMTVNAATEHVYYVSATGDNAKDGKTEANAMKTVAAAVKVAENATGYAAGDSVVIKVSGVVNEGGSLQGLLGSKYQAIYVAGTKTKIPVIVEGTTADAAIKFDAGKENWSNRRFAYLDIVFKNISIQVTGDKKLALIAGSGDLTFDNVKFAEDVKWIIYANPISKTPMSKGDALGLTEYHPTVTFKNGDYTALDEVAVISQHDGSNIDLTDAYAAMVHPKMVIESTAKMGTVAFANVNIKVADATLEIKKGAQVANVKKTTEGVTIGYTFNFIDGNAAADPAPAPSTPSTADASEIVLFSFLAVVSLAGVAVVSKTRA